MIDPLEFNETSTLYPQNVLSVKPVQFREKGCSLVKKVDHKEKRITFYFCVINDSSFVKKCVIDTFLCVIHESSFIFV